MRKNRIHGGCTLWARQTIESEIFGKPAKWFKIWFYLVSRANHTDNAGLKRGQCHLTYVTIMLKCKATKAEVDHSIRWFKDRRMLATTKATRGFVVTILNYDRYQNMDNYRSDRINKNVIMEINVRRRVFIFKFSFTGILTTVGWSANTRKRGNVRGWLGRGTNCRPTALCHRTKTMPSR